VPPFTDGWPADEPWVTALPVLLGAGVAAVCFAVAAVASDRTGDGRTGRTAGGAGRSRVRADRGVRR
jgi:hypothetical protein